MKKTINEAPAPLKSFNRTVSDYELDRAKTAIEQFLYSCSHTLRGPLKSISGLVNLLKSPSHMTDMDPQIYLASIEKTVLKMEGLLNELEQFLTNSRQDLITRAIDIQRLLRVVMEDFAEAIQRKNIKVSLDINEDVSFYADESRLRVILTNLISNAVEFQDLKKENHEIFISVHITEDNAEIEVRDNGVGINPGIQDKIFTLFYRGSDISSGSGVGLYIVREVVDKMGGSIRVFSAQGQGAAFFVSLPNLYKK